MGADNFATHHSVSVPLINKFVFLPGCQSLDFPISLLPKLKKYIEFQNQSDTESEK